MKLLDGLRVVDTSARSFVAVALRDAGADALSFPTVEIAPPLSWERLDAALEALARGDYDWVVVASQNAVRSLRERTRLLGLPVDWSRIAVAAVGPKTAASLRHFGVDPQLVPRRQTAAALASKLPAGPGRILFPRVEAGPGAVVESLRAKGWEVDEVDAYRNLIPEHADDSALLERGFDAVTLASASAARNLAQLVEPERWGIDVSGRRKVVCIGPATAECARDVGLRVDAVAVPHTTEGLVRALAILYGRLDPDGAAAGSGTMSR